jgi:hypothetical protein
MMEGGDGMDAEDIPLITKPNMRKTLFLFTGNVTRSCVTWIFSWT